MDDREKAVPTAAFVRAAFLNAVRPGTFWAHTHTALAPSPVDDLVEALVGARRTDRSALSAVLKHKADMPQPCGGDPVRGAVLEAEYASILADRPQSTGQGVGALTVFDARCLQDTAYRDRGIGRHAKHVLEVLRKSSPKLVGLLDSRLPPPERAVALAFDSLISRPLHVDIGQVGLLVEPSPLTHALGPVAPLIAATNVMTVAVAHDFIPLDEPAAYLNDPAERLAYAARMLALSRYDRLMANSHDTGRRAREELSLRGDQVVVTGCRDALTQPDGRSHRPARPYVLAPSGDHARKNLPAALGAFTLVRRERPNLQMRVFGGLSADARREIDGVCATLGLADCDVLFVEHLDDGDLAALYAGAEVSVLPSLAEGFSLPVAESVHRGTPVIASDLPAHRELLGMGWWLAEPTDVVGLSAALERALAAPHQLLSLQLQGLGDIALEEAVSRGVQQAIRCLPVETDSAVRQTDKPRVALVSPFPPEQSGVADYSAYTARAIARRVDLTVFTDGRVTDHEIATGPLTAEPYLAETPYDSVIAVLGNSHFHVPMVEYLQDFGGSCLAHDNRMVEFYTWWRGEEAAAKALADAGHPGGVDRLREHLHDVSTLPDLFYGEIAPSANRMVVHAEALAARIERETGVAPGVARFVPYNLPETPPCQDQRAAARQRCGLDADVVHLATFGEADCRTKGVDRVVGALGWLTRWGIECRLHIVGKAEPVHAKEIATAASAYGVAERVDFHGRVSRAVMDDYLLGVNLGVQLRTSGLLTLSGALADCIAFGLPTLATREMARDLDAPEYVARIAAEAGPFLIAEAIQTLLGRALPMAEIEEQRARYLQSRSAERYAEELMSALGGSGKRP